MRNKFLTKLFIIVIFLFPIIVKAECSEELRTLFNENEEDFSIIYEMDPSTKKYTVYYYNPLPDKFDYADNLPEGIEWEIYKENLTANYDVPVGKYEAYVVGITGGCENTIFQKIEIDLPEPSKLSEDEHCKGIEEFVLCQPDYDKEISYEDFVSRTETYRKTKAKKEEEEKKNKEKERNQIITKIVNYINDNLVTIVIVIIFIVVVVASFIVGIKSFRKSRRLE